MSFDLSKLAVIGAGMLVAPVATAALVGATFDIHWGEDPDQKAARERREILQFGALTAGVLLAGYLLGGKRPDSFGRGVMYGTAVLPALVAGLKGLDVAGVPPPTGLKRWL